MHYSLNNTAKKLNRKYKREQLYEMTTFQLRNICLNERIVKGVINNLDRQKFIDTILKYRGVRDSYLIEEYTEEGFERLNEIIKNCLSNKLLNKGLIKIPAKISFYPEIGIDKSDNYRVRVDDSLMGESNVFVLNDKNELCGIFKLTADDFENNVYYITADANMNFKVSTNKNYSFLFFEREEAEAVYRMYNSDIKLFSNNLKYYKITIPELEIVSLEDTNSILAVDFGTSNTTAGAYIGNSYVSKPCYNDILNEKIKMDEINLVKFKDVTSTTERWLEVLPTVVYVEDCSNTENIKYSFGYEAVQKLRRNDYICSASVFQGIKRWVNSYNKIEEIYDEAGNTAQVKRGEIIKAYLEYVIETSEHQFKCKFKKLHISSPVKLKQQFIDMFSELMNKYKIEDKEALDEGVAVLYNTIEGLIEKKNFYAGEEYKALVIDCGGGTTDLSSCSFTINEGKVSYKIDIDTMYENGDTNFGGNNITYRIMQFIKIILAGYYKNKTNKIEIDDLIEIMDSDIFRYIDENGVEKLYEDFQNTYDSIEDIIPTKFKNYENRSKDEYIRVKNNFYFLWEISDSLKQEFYKRTSTLRSKFGYRRKNDCFENDLIITPLKKWDLSIIENGKLTRVCEFPDVTFNIREINKLIKGDIYEVIRKFLDGFYESGRLQDYSVIKLTGQSCKINIFKEALKEFVPGKSIEFRQKKEEDEGVSDLKLSCLKGVVRYLNAKSIGNIEVNIRNEAPIVPYSVSALTYNNQEITMICSLEKINQEKGSVSRPIGTTEIEFYLKNTEGKLRHAYNLKNDFEKYVQVSEEEITTKYSNQIYQEDTDTIINGEIKFFVFAHEKSWGFYVLPIGRKSDILYMGKRKYFAFENDLSELDFFDGLK